MHVRDLLDVKGSAVFSCRPSDTLADVVRLLAQWNCGSLVVLDGEQMVGIITERDVVRACSDMRSPLEFVRVAEKMTASPVTASPTDDVDHLMGVMTNRRLRHLPVVEAGRLVGLISIGDVVKAEHDELTRENHYLKAYIQS